MLVVAMECRLKYCGCLGNQKAACVRETKLLFMVGGGGGGRVTLGGPAPLLHRYLCSRVRYVCKKPHNCYEKFVQLWYKRAKIPSTCTSTKQEIVKFFML